MRFFSNEAKETDEEHENDRTEGSTVPQQRSGSPWSDAPGSASDSSEDADLNGRDGLRTDDSEVRHDGDDLVRDDDSPRSVGHDDLDLPLDGRATTDEDRSGTDEFAAGSHRADAQAGTTDAPVDATEGSVDGGPYEGTTTTYGPDGSVTTNDEPAATDDALADPLYADTTAEVDRSDVDEATPVVATAPVDTTDSTDTETDAATDAGFADTAAVDAPVDATSVDDTATDADAAPVVAAVPADTAATPEAATPEAATPEATTPEAAKPDPTANPVGDKLFTDGDSFNERLRDITFNFVDNPKEATEQAGSLVDEAIDKVTSAFKAQKDALAAEGDDTEKLRVELRGYRDLLRRLTAL
jgi:hypothetical protein